MNSVQHYLLTLTAPGGHMHGYLLSNDPKSCERAIEKILQIAEEQGLRVLPTILLTTLSTGVEPV